MVKRAAFKVTGKRCVSRRYYVGGLYCLYVRLLTAIEFFTSFELDEPATVCSTLNSYYTQGLSGIKFESH